MFNLKTWIFVIPALVTAGCGKGADSFSTLATSNSFIQGAPIVVNNKVDILWIVDGSGTMANHQTNLANNFNKFISQFVTKGLDYHMAVASTDAWVREVNYNGGTCVSNPNPSQNPNTMYTSSADCLATLANFGQLTHFRDGDIYGAAGGAPGTRSGVYLLTSLMNPITVMSTFATNVRTGTRGDGAQESAFQSLRAVLRRNSDGSIGYGGETHTSLNSFRRNEAFFATIIVTDEEDQSKKQNGTNYANTQDYVNNFVTFLDGYTGSVPGDRNYNVSGIVLTDINNCPYGLHPQATQGDRYVAIANATGGVVSSICSTDFSQQLTAIAENIVVMASRFQIDREPIVSTIQVSVDGVSIPQGATNGWTYVTENGFYYIEFHGTAIPAQGASIVVNYDPVTVVL